MIGKGSQASCTGQAGTRPAWLGEREGGRERGVLSRLKFLRASQIG